MPGFLAVLTILAALILVCYSWLLTDGFAQNTIAECGPNLLPLTPCAPFVQGLDATPVQPCCVSLSQLYSQKPSCICLLLHDTNLASSFPINTTRALQLPVLCNLQIDTSTCGGTSLSPPTEVSFGARPNSSAAASPIVTVAPRPSIMGFGYHHNAEVRLKAKAQFSMLLLAAILAGLTKPDEP